MKHTFKYLLLSAAILALPLQAASSRIIFNGGITTDEREAAPATGTKLEFVVTTGSFLSAINVMVADSAGNEVVSTVTAGPWLILDLAPGTYRVTATRRNGEVQGADIQVGGEPAKITFMFKDN